MNLQYADSPLTWCIFNMQARKETRQEPGLLRHISAMQKPENTHNGAPLTPEEIGSPQLGEVTKIDPPLGDPSADRTRLIELWKKAPVRQVDYLNGQVYLPDGTSYSYQGGTTLYVGGEQVMDECEIPWAFSTVDRTFLQLGERPYPIRVLERGWGMGIVARRVISHMVVSGGTYVGIELNHKIAEDAREWMKKQPRGLRTMAHGMQAAEPKINIKILEGDAYEETLKLAKRDEGFDIIISDTFPLSREEQGINDLRDLETLKQCLAPGGVFTFYAYFPGSTGGIVRKQENMIVEHFNNYSLSHKRVFPPPHYKYLQTEKGPVTNLPVVICWNPKL